MNSENTPIPATTLESGSNLTPMLKQYHSLKTQNPSCVLLFRLGDFYEMFYEDAKIVSHALDLVLTARGKGTSSHVPMCGFPHHAANNYIARLVKTGHKVAICDQMEDPALAKGIVKRDITRVITAGTYLDETDTSTRYILALFRDKKSYGFSFTDPANGTIQTNILNLENAPLINILCRLPIYECLFPENDADFFKHLFNEPLLKSRNIALSAYPEWNFNHDISYKALCEHFEVHNLHGFSLEDKPAAIRSCGALLQYLKDMNKQPLRHIDRISIYTDDEFAYISPAAIRGLELEGLVKTIDHSRTAMGKRQIWFWLYHPLKNRTAIEQRQNAVTLFKNHTNIQTNLKHYLDQIPDIEKTISRLSCGYTHPKDLLAIRNTLALIPEIITLIKPLCSQNTLFNLNDILPLREQLIRYINEDIPLSKPDGKVIKSGVNSELDDLKNIQHNGQQWLKNFQEQEIRASGINSLKVGFNKVFGYYIELTNNNIKSAPAHYIRKQTLVNGERFITQELKEYEEKILTAQDKILALENTIIQQLRQDILAYSSQLHHLAEEIATIDALYSLCILAQSHNYIAPKIADDFTLAIQNGRHPIVEINCAESFIANDTLLDTDENQLLILTGPNMSGKSTYIRQTALLAIMAQAGSYIPASTASVGIIDKFFTRIGAHDDISKGQSTFMVEMNEAADILNNLSPRSLVILDEIGRGTSTYDGLSLAWAIAEYLKQSKTRTLFATHFHELTALAQENSGVKNYNVAVKEWKNEIIFLHKIIPGATDDSYGIYVAKLAGIPHPIIKQAKGILTKLELKTDLKQHLSGQAPSQKQIDFFTPVAESQNTEIIEELKNIDINSLTPMDALKKIAEFIERLKT